ncbi:MAG: UDP-N-acetylmuramate--L-alanine ligase [Candidatus Zixiibacteriota bacterium]
MIKFRKIKKIHMVGIGGTGMCGIAEVLWNSGYKVTGSDSKLTEVTKRLGKLGIRISQGHRSEHVEDADVVVISSAISNGNPEVIFAEENKIPVIRRSEMLGELMRMKFGIGVSGTHGKTTTTSMIGQILTQGGLDPTIVVGGKVIGWESNSKLGEGEYLVAEADEFDRSFLRLTPTVAVITTLEAEHLDYYKDLKEIEEAFLEFLNKVPFYGSVILCLDEESLQNLLPRIKKRIITYGLLPQSDLQAVDLNFRENISSFKVKHKNKMLGELDLMLPGIHNVKNSLAAVAVGLELDIPWEKIKDALDNFQGVNRRLEIKGEINQVMVMDDYAHHPTEIEVSLRAVREGWKRRIITVFQPHLFSRTRDFHQEFGRSFFNSDILVITAIYPAREKPIPGITSEMIARAAKEYGHREVHYIPETDDVVPFLLKNVRKNDLVITMGAGDVYRIGEEFISSLSSDKDFQQKEQS